MPRRRTDDRRTSGPAANSFVASARILSEARRGAIPKPASWQDEAWGYYDSVGEVRFAASWYGNALSRVRLGLAERGQAGAVPTLLPPDDPRNRYLDQLAGGSTGQAQLLADFAPHLVVPGLCYLVGVEEDGTDVWRVLSYDELAVKDDTFQWQTGPKSWDPLPPNSLPVQVWRAHPRYHYLPDSPIRPLLPILRELSLLSAHVDATATSRLAGAGVFAIPAEATFPISPDNADADDPFLAEFMDAMLTPIADREAASAVVPLLMRVPGEHLDKLQHITFDTPFDERSLALREEAIRRYANGMDMPAEVLLGMGDSNHWTAWQIEEGAVKLHVVPMVETIVHALTIGWWRPLCQTLAASGDPVAGAEDLVVWYDLAGLVVRPDRSGDAKDLYGMDAIGLGALLRECGFDPEDAPTDEETRRKVVLQIIQGAPTLAPVLLPVIGVSLDVPADAQPLPDPNGTPTAPQALPAEAGGTQGPPARPDQAGVPTGAPSGGTGAVTASLAPNDAALLAAGDLLVRRALEHAGNRLRNAARSADVDLNGIPAHERHLHVDATCLADLDRLLASAWDGLPDICARYDADADAVEDLLDTYTRAILAARVPHTWDRLVTAFTGE